MVSMDENSGKKIIRRNKEASIARIINATATVFAKRGYENTTYTEIARLADLNISLISRYFGSKDKLLQATLNVLVSKLRFSFENVPQKDSLKEEFHSIAEILISSFLEYPNETKAIANIASHSQLFRNELYLLRESNESIYNRLQPFYDSGEIHHSHNLEYAVDTYITVVNAIMSCHYLVYGLPISNVRNRIHYTTELYIKGLLVENNSPYPDTFICEKP